MKLKQGNPFSRKKHRNFREEIFRSKTNNFSCQNAATKRLVERMGSDVRNNNVILNNKK